MRLGEEEERGGGRGVEGARWSGKDMARAARGLERLQRLMGQCNASVGCWRRVGLRGPWLGERHRLCHLSSPHLTAPHRTAPHAGMHGERRDPCPVHSAAVGGSGKGHGDGQHAVWPRHSLPHDARSRSGRWRPSATASVKLDLAASQPQPAHRSRTLPSNMVGGYFVRILQQRASRTLQPAPFTAGSVARPVSDAGLAAHGQRLWSGRPAASHPRPAHNTQHPTPTAGHDAPTNHSQPANSI
jgi:hypothetical protein